MMEILRCAPDKVAMKKICNAKLAFHKTTSSVYHCVQLNGIYKPFEPAVDVGQQTSCRYVSLDEVLPHTTLLARSKPNH